MYGSDQSASLEPKGFKSLIEGVNKVCEAIGSNKLGQITKEEIEIAKKLRQHIEIK